MIILLVTFARVQMPSYKPALWVMMQLSCAVGTVNLSLFSTSAFFLASPVILEGFMLMPDHSKGREKFWWICRINII